MWELILSVSLIYTESGEAGAESAPHRTAACGEAHNLCRRRVRACAEASLFTNTVPLITHTTRTGAVASTLSCARLPCITLAPFSRAPRRAEAKAFKPAEFFRTPEELLGRAFNRPTVDQLRERAAAPEGPQQEALLRKAQRGKPAAGYRELVARTNRLKALEAALEATEAEKAMMGKGRKRKIAPAHNVMVGRVGLDGTVEGDGPKVKRPAAFRWKAERKR